MEQTSRNMPRDVFLYLLSIITLVVSAVSFGVLVFQLINVNFPDLINSGYYYSADSYLETIRMSLATLIIVFPVFLWVTRFLQGDVTRYPEKKDLKIRRWLLYLTLFAAALLIIGDLVAILNNLLHGELTIRFILKALTILFIAGSVLYHYLSELRDRPIKGIKIFRWVVMFVVIASVVAGFFYIGSPVQQRKKAFDQRRVNDLQMIQNEVINFWQSKGQLPKNLGKLTNSISGFKAPVDPESGKAYEYIIKSDQKTTFQLCGVFNYANSEADPFFPKTRLMPDIYNNWTHGAGHYCFERAIDPDLYPLRPK